MAGVSAGSLIPGVSAVADSGLFTPANIPPKFYKLGSWGDSRASCTSPSTLISPTGSGNYLQGIRTAPFIAGFLGDTEFVANFGLGGDLASAWALTTRADSKTISNLIAGNLYKGGNVDAVFIQYGINDYIGGATGASVAGNIQALCGALMGAGIKVILEATNPAASANYGATPATKLQNTIDGNTILKNWANNYAGQLVFVDTFSALVDGTGYASSIYYADGLHFNALGAILAAQACAAAARTLLPKRTGFVFSNENKITPNLIDWSSMSSGTTLFTANNIGTVAATTPTWNYDSLLNAPYAEVTFTVSTLAGGYAQARFEIHANTISGATPRYSISIGDELQGTAFITADDGNSNPAQIQALSLRHRLYSDSKFADDGTTVNAAGSTYIQGISRRFTTPTFVTATASVGISAPAVGAGYSLQVIVEFNTVGQTARIRVYAPVLRVVNSGGTITQPTAGASPYTYINNTGAPVFLYVAGGTVSSIGLSRQGTVFTTGLTSGVFLLNPRDSVTITYTVIPTLTVEPFR